MRFLTVLTLALTAAHSLAQIKLKLEFPADGPREIWVGSGLPQSKHPSTAKSTGATADFAPEGFGPRDRLFVLDTRTGNLASKPIGEISGSWKLAEADFSRIGAVRVRVEHKGRAVESASVVLTSGKTVQNGLIDSSSGGEVLFFGMEPGQVRAAVTYKTIEGATPDPIKQSTDVALKRSRPEVVMVVSITDEVATVDEATATGAAGSPSGGSSTKAEGGGSKGGATKDGGSFIGRLISFLLALGVAALAVFFGLKWLKANQDRVQDKLSSMGVEIPKPGDGSADPSPAPNTPIAPPPPAQILLDDSSPTPLSSPSPLSVPTGQPRLVSESGDELPLDEGSLTVGREAGLGLSLINESTVSRNHAEIVRSGPSVRVRDLGSTNGTFVNGVQVTGESELRPGDQVQFGAIRFRFEG